MAEFEKLAHTAAQIPDGEMQTLLPGAHGKTALQVLKEWYRCDKNVVLPDPLEAGPDHTPSELHPAIRARQNLCDGRDYKRRKDDPTKDTQDLDAMSRRSLSATIVNAAFPANRASGSSGVDWCATCCRSK